ncbi:MAG: DUF1636 family protein [Methyloligellaceae bacterium]
MSEKHLTTVIVCTTCRMTDTSGTERSDGDKLLEQLSNAELPSEVEVKGVECLSACSNSCCLVVTGGDNRWSYVYGNLDPALHAEEVLNGIRAYSETEDGIVPWRQRPTVFKKQSIARIPPRSHME